MSEEQQKTLPGNLSDIDPDFDHAIRALINAKVRDYMGNKGKLNALSRSCNPTISVSTLSKLAYYETARPAMRTVLTVASALECIEEIGEILIASAIARRGGQPEVSAATRLSEYKAFRGRTVAPHKTAMQRLKERTPT